MITLTYSASRGGTFGDIHGTSQEIIVRWFARTGRRSEISLATRSGGEDLRPDAPSRMKPHSKPWYIVRRLECSLEDLRTCRRTGSACNTSIVSIRRYRSKILNRSRSPNPKRAMTYSHVQWYILFA
ncbi:uncharacterized protein C8Q71DRAFT_780954 [Rhodofomes roseus]|uniref:Uncharacterized protein n=1 Tax=Rhodofomes roseus TaxID=34475 RepID=A0ABQ8K3S7_9APHY|nr:uncharacterized protein C8Q71DRAFT_780954 [Rhodofomes roseus]KAH9831516.1 hypothetical protein C8Q71DRAFT_780954 [Rhodofomes roseus]